MPCSALAPQCFVHSAWSVNVYCTDLNYKLLEVNNICPIYFAEFQRALKNSSLMMNWALEIMGLMEMAPTQLGAN